MSITDELRREARGFLTYIYTAEQAERLLAIADRIDAEHERSMADAELAAAPTEAQLEELGYIALPVDADGEVWHVGDFAAGDVNPRNPEVIERMIWYGPDSGWQLETNTIIYPCPDRPRHHHEPTVEDVLREFGKAWVEWEDGAAMMNPVETFAAKLRLAGDAE